MEHLRDVGVLAFSSRKRPTAAIMLTSKHAPVDLCNIWAFIQEDILLYTQEGPRRVEEGVNGMLSKYDVTNVHTPSALDVHSALHSVNGARDLT